MPKQPNRPSIVLIGHCGFDSAGLRGQCRAALPGVPVVDADNDEQLQKVAGDGGLLLINRVLSGGFPEPDGVALARRLAQQQHPARTLVITNYPDVQREAVDAGAMPGFGKNDLGTDRATTRLKEAWAAVTATV